MWGASARAHVHTSFERWCLLARSSIADQGVILVLKFIIIGGEVHPKSTYRYKLTPMPLNRKRPDLDTGAARTLATGVM